jgi:hypothetical protein
MKMFRFMIGIGLLGMLMTACNAPQPSTPEEPEGLPEDMPADFHVRSEYFGQAVSPVYHYDYFIVLHPAGTDTISFHPDYMESNPPVWIETFAAGSDDLENLWDLMVSEDIFRDDWVRSADTLFGAWTRMLHVTAENRSYTVPTWVQDTTAAHAVYRRIDAIVPAAVWDSLWTWRERYISGDTTAIRP